jgi:hypothetical protein
MDNSIINDNERLKKTNVMKLNSNSMRKWRKTERQYVKMKRKPIINEILILM